MSKAFRLACKDLVPADAKYVAVIWVPGERTQVEKLGPKRIVRLACQAFKRWQGRLPETLGQVLGWVQTWYDAETRGSDCQASILPYATWKEEENERERRACEKLAARIVQQYNVKPNTMEFISAVYQHYETIMQKEYRFQHDPEVRAERWAEASFQGCSSSFWEDNDYSAGIHLNASEELERLIRYLHRTFPLLVAKWNARQK